MEPRDVFVSHVAEDGPTARALAKALAAQDLSTWTYEDDGVAGISHLEQSSEAIESCHAFVLLASRRSVNARQVIREVEQAYEAERVIIPVRMGLTHEEFVASNRIVRMACGTAVSLAADEGDLSEAAKRISATLRFAESQVKRTDKREPDREVVEQPRNAIAPSSVTPRTEPLERPSETSAGAVLPLASVSAARTEATDAPEEAAVAPRTGAAEPLWPTIWLGIIGQFYLAGLLLDYTGGEHPVIAVAGVVAVAGCGLGLAWAFVKLRDSSATTSISSPFMNFLLGTTVVAQVVANLALEPRLLWLTIPFIAFIWNGWRVLRKPVNTAAMVT